MKDETELISIIVPVYNVEPYLERCIDSIIGQTYKDLEIVLVDDGSTDRSGEICDTYEKKDVRVRVCHKCNGGLASARNKGLEIASGKYIGFVDSDDYIAPDMYESLYRYMREDIDIVSCGIVRIDMRGRKTKTCYAREVICLNKIQSLRELLCRRYLEFSACDKLYKRAVIGEIRFPNNRICEDLPFMYQVVKGCNKIINIGECKYFYCYRDESISRKEFYPRRIDYVLFARDILRDVRIKYPCLRKEVEFLYVINIMEIITQLSESPNKLDYDYMYKRLLKAVKRMRLLIIANPLIPYELKLRCIKLRGK